MKILYLLAFCIISWGVYLIVQPKARSTILYTLAIGSIVNGFIFTADAFPIMIGKFPFGMDSVVYVLFLFCVTMMYAYYGKKETITLVIACIAAVVFAGIIEGLTVCSIDGLTDQLVQKLFGYLVRSVGSILSCIVVVCCWSLLRKYQINCYLNLAVTLLVASIVNAIVCYLTFLFTSVYKVSSMLFNQLVAMYLGQFIAIGFAVVTAVISNYKYGGKCAIPYEQQIQ